MPVDTAAVLDVVTDLELSTWRYKHNGGATHMGPMAEEFYAAFELGDDDEHIATVDADGVALAAIQDLASNKTGVVSPPYRSDQMIASLHRRRSC
ncbi:hypothetical protein C468_01845 [Halorubrum kocurii JCM 14978]|uniref:Peptidase S74 domain-containing protein n=1 Tax=Halorubrum kocurii JCM 14978 TaxID=1230456 RepID=M0PKI3_9EURY|nr:tail fiber domain-containing protein [Halorubrum kocurii]EMA69270.1 hypothetical protein C468_01845 [Halorubrum kocurii JCM 14978]